MSHENSTLSHRRALHGILSRNPKLLYDSDDNTTLTKITVFVHKGPVSRKNTLGLVAQIGVHSVTSGSPSADLESADDAVVPGSHVWIILEICPHGSGN